MKDHSDNSDTFSTPNDVFLARKAPSQDDFLYGAWLSTALKLPKLSVKQAVECPNHYVGHR